MEFFKDIVQTMFRFYAHNGIIIFFMLGVLTSLLMSLRYPSRRNFLSFVGFLLLILSFEYQKHFTPHFYTNLVLPTADPELDPLRYSVETGIIKSVVPIFLDITGWGAIILALLMPTRHKE